MSNETSPTLRNLKPTEYAPFRNPEGLPSSDELLLVYDLSDWIADPVTAKIRERRKFDISSGGGEGFSWDKRVFDAASDSLATLATKGQTYLVQELADGILSSPLARIQNDKFGGSTAKAPQKSVKERTSDRSSVNPPDISLLLGGLEEVLSRSRQYKHEAFAVAEQELAEKGYLSAGDLEKDSIFLSSQSNRDLVSMEARMWHMAYEMSPDTQEYVIKPFTFEMAAVGELSSSEVSSEFFEKFMDGQPVDYKEIIDAGLLYTPIQMSSDTIGFYEESGQLIEVFQQTDDLEPGEKAVRVNVWERIAQLLPDADPIEMSKTGGAHQLLAGNLKARNILETSLGMRFDQITFDEQILLCKLLMRATPEQMHAIVPQGPNMIVKVARALEFGDDYGNSILSIAEHAPPKESNEIFETVNKFREHSAKFAGWFKDFDPQFAEATERAMNERLTDALYSLEKIARTGGLEVDVAPHRHSPDYESDGRFTARFNSLDHGLDVLDNLEKTLDLQTKILTAPDVVISKVVENEVTGFSIYRAVSRTYGQMLIYVREYGAEKYARDFEYGGYDGVEGSVSFIVNPLDPHGHLSVSKDPDGVSVRFDRQGYGIDESPFVEERSPIREKGSVSLDISSILGNPKSMPTQIAYLIAAGNQLRAEKVGSAESLNHNTNGFDQEIYGTIEGFAELPRYTKRNLDAMIANQRGRKLGSLVSRRQNTPEGYPEAA